MYFTYIRQKVSNLSHTGDREALLKDIITHILSKTIQDKKLFKTNIPHPTPIKLIFTASGRHTHFSGKQHEELHPVAEII